MRRHVLCHPLALAAILSLLALVSHPTAASAQDPGKPPGSSEQTPQPPGPEKEQMNMMGNMLGTVIEANMKAFITLLGKPEVAEKLASFTKNYYDALVAKGFSKEEALRIVTASGFGNLPGQK